jgi:prepilin-type N-terminal cleavage/methylation domain-containing protein
MRPRRQKISSFTLVELLAVITIIAILAGLVLGGAGAVRQRASRGQAKAEIAAIEAGLGRYQMDMGVYPLSSGIAPAGANYAVNPSGYISSGQALFAALWGGATYAATNSGAKQYLNVKSSKVMTSGSADYLIDPWGYAYGYYWSGTNSLFGGAVPDVWSTGGQSGTGTQTNRLKWITSWE